MKRGRSPIPKHDPFEKPLLSVDLFFTLYKNNASQVRKLEEKLEPLGLTLGRLCLLYALQRAGKPALPSELGDDLAVTRANISGLLNALEKAGLVRRELDLSDRRRVFVHMTPQGEKLLELAWPVYEETIEGNFGSLSVEEQMQLLHLLRKLEQGK